MKIWINVYRLRSAPKVPFALAFNKKKVAKRRRHVVNGDLEYVRTVKVQA